jgi:hypothetical protein
VTGTDLAVGWWAFWLSAGFVIFWGLIWVLYRLGVWSDEAAWHEFVSERAEEAEQDEPTVEQGRAPETPRR